MENEWKIWNTIFQVSFQVMFVQLISLTNSFISSHLKYLTLYMISLMSPLSYCDCFFLSFLSWLSFCSRNESKEFGMYLNKLWQSLVLRSVFDLPQMNVAANAVYEDNIWGSGSYNPQLICHWKMEIMLLNYFEASNKIIAYFSLELNGSDIKGEG